MSNLTKHHRSLPLTYTQEERRAFYSQWKRSGKSKAAFSRSVGIAKSAFYSWCAQFESELSHETIFSPVTVTQAPAENATGQMTPLEIWLPNQTKIVIPMPQSNVIPFIQELCHATTAIQ